ncbi:MAG: hypothetical protein ACE5Q6_23500, partial [Dehalococcoidia bacterium]
MSTTRPAAEIIDLTYQHLEEAAEVLAAAFYDDPLLNYLLAGLGDDFAGCLQEFFRFTCEIRLELDGPIWGAVSNGQIQGVACLSLPDEPEWTPSLGDKLQRLRQCMGPLGSERLERYAGIVGESTTKQTHIFLGALGVHPRAQGQG